MTTRKVEFAQNVKSVCTSLVIMINKLEDLKDVYGNEDYGVGQADEIIDVDIETTEIPAADLHNIMTAVAPAFKNLVSNMAVNAGTYAKFMDRVRSL